MIGLRLGEFLGDGGPFLGPIPAYFFLFQIRIVLCEIETQPRSGTSLSTDKKVFLWLKFEEKHGKNHMLCRIISISHVHYRRHT